jgi:hypothetical protein
MVSFASPFAETLRPSRDSPKTDAGLAIAFRKHGSVSTTPPVGYANDGDKFAVCQRTHTADILGTITLAMRPGWGGRCTAGSPFGGNVT